MSLTILQQVKHNTGVSESSTSFDSELLTHIFLAVSVLIQLGVDEYLPVVVNEMAEFPEIQDPALAGLSKAYLLLKVKTLFNPSQNTVVNGAQQNNILEYEGRIQLLTGEEPDELNNV